MGFEFELALWGLVARKKILLLWGESQELDFIEDFDYNEDWETEVGSAISLMGPDSFIECQIGVLSEIFDSSETFYISLCNEFLRNKRIFLPSDEVFKMHIVYAIALFLRVNIEYNDNMEDKFTAILENLKYNFEAKFGISNMSKVFSLMSINQTTICRQVYS